MSCSRFSLFAAILLPAFVAEAQTFESLYNWPHEGAQPEARVLYHEGAYWGTTYAGGAYANPTTNFFGYGTAFKLTRAGTLTVLHQFDQATLGANPFGGLTLGADGNLYGTTRFGLLGSTTSGGGAGAYFQLTTAGVATRLFAPSLGTSFANPIGEMLLRPDGTLIGVGEAFFSSSSASFFKLTPSPLGLDSLRAIQKFSEGTPRAGFFTGSDGNYYGSTRFRVLRINAADDSSTTLFSNSTDLTKGYGFEHGYTQGLDGAFYGTAETGGANSGGVVWKLSADGTEYLVLHSFTGDDGRAPRCRLVRASDGAFYGTTNTGGTSDLGVIFKVTTDGTFSVVHHFSGSDGANPRSLIEADGRLVGTTAAGGLCNAGTVFEYTFAGELTVVKDFGNPDGLIPDGPATFASDGNVYGALAWGGPANRGAIYRRLATGEVELVHAFSAGEGLHPTGPLVEGGDGALYGTFRGTFGQLQGGVFRVTKAGESEVLKSFPVLGGARGPVVERADGVIFGVNAQGNGSASIYRVAPGVAYKEVKTLDAAVVGLPQGVLFPTEAGAFFFFASDPVTSQQALFHLETDGTVAKLGATGFGAFATPPIRGASGSFHAIMRNGAELSPTNLSLVSVTPAGVVTTQAISGTNDFFSGSLVEREPGIFYAFTATPGANATLARKLYRIASNGAATLVRDFGNAASPLVRNGLTQFIAPGFGGTVVPGGIYVDTALTLGPDDHLYGTLPQDTVQAGGELFRIVLPARSGTAPSAATGFSTNVSVSAATVAGTAVANGAEAFGWIEYGRGAGYGQRTTPVPLGSASEAVGISADLAFLKGGTTYHYRTVAVSAAGVSYGLEQIFVTQANVAPTAVADTGNVRSTSETATIAVLANDSDADGNTFTIDDFSQGAFGTVTRVGDSLRYTPGPGYTGGDSFTYTIVDANGAFASATVTIANPLLSLAGDYTSYFANGTGFLLAKLTTGGGITGRVRLPNGTTFAITGVLGLDGKLRKVIRRPGLASLVVDLAFTLENGIGYLGGLVKGSAAENYPVTPQAFFAPTVTPPAFVGSYTVRLAPPSTASARLRGAGWAIVSVKTTGAFTFAGQLPDGTPLSLSSRLRADDRLTLAASVTTPRTLLTGEVAFTNAAGSDFTGTMRWRRAATAGKFFPALIDLPLTVTGVRYVPPTAGNRALEYLDASEPFALAQLTLTDGNLTTPIVRALQVSAADVVTVTDANPQRVAFTLIDRTTGRFMGRFKHPAFPATALPVKFQGVFMQNAHDGTDDGPNEGHALFIGRNANGNVTFTPFVQPQ